MEILKDKDVSFMTFRCAECNKEIPKPFGEDDKGKEVVRVETELDHNIPKLWFFCNMKCFEDYVKKSIKESE